MQPTASDTPGKPVTWASMSDRPICAICWEGQHRDQKAPVRYAGFLTRRRCGRCGRHTIAGLTEPIPK